MVLAPAHSPFTGTHKYWKRLPGGWAPRLLLALLWICCFPLYQQKTEHERAQSRSSCLSFSRKDLLIIHPVWCIALLSKTFLNLRNIRFFALGRLSLYRHFGFSINYTENNGRGNWAECILWEKKLFSIEKKYSNDMTKKIIFSNINCNKNVYKLLAINKWK